MFKSRLEGALEWVRDNCPRSAMLGPEKTLEIVEKVFGQTSAVRVLLNVGGSVLGLLAGMYLADHWSVTRDSQSLYIGSITLGAVLVGLLASVAGDYYLHRKLEAAFEKA